MKWLSDQALDRLRAAVDAPDLSGTGYVLLDKLGAGGMGGVFRVKDTALGRQVALKMIGIVDSSGELSARLLREARIIAQLEHPGIVPVHDVGTLPDGRVFYTMKLVQGRRLDQHRDELGGVPERLRTFQKICDAVSFAHAHNVLHRDLKPQNIMVGQFGEVLVMDWGLAKLLDADIPAQQGAPQQLPRSEEDASKDTAHGVVLGTPGYMAPEQERGEVEAVGPRADVYSLGAVLKFLLDDSGRASKALSAIAGKATAGDAKQRYGSVEELANDVANYLDGLPVSAYPEGPLARLWRWVVKNRAWILLVVAYLVMRAVFILWRRR
ncbi:MAG: serine/threonine protein kinase [Acidobacteriia bacterium]|nr:serine/threonine protein kinase [Terriglobia bacterium]